MKSALVDTNVAAAWLGGEIGVRDQVVKVLSQLGETPTLFVSVVTVQEMMVWAHIMSKAQGTLEFLSRFTALEFTADCALRAATLAAAVGRPARSKPRSSTDRGNVELWQRDAAIAGTAAVRKVDMLVTRDGDFNRFIEHVEFRIVVVT